MTPLQQRFADAFGADQADAVMSAARYHADAINGSNRGADEFRWALALCITHECMSRDEFRAAHKISASWPAIRAWIIREADLGSHDGDVDPLGLLAGMLNEYTGHAPFWGHA